ncbi:hypothetical protein [Paraburkholderia sp. GAS32]|uniref:hypothetical protein n=1 Tax=Paraburkholderia sp. GAS32 TaxID=3035129 RepID=UPI003D1D4EB3
MQTVGAPTRQRGPMLTLLAGVVVAGILAALMVNVAHTATARACYKTLALKDGSSYCAPSKADYDALMWHKAHPGMTR